MSFLWSFWWGAGSSPSEQHGVASLPTPVSAPRSTALVLGGGLVGASTAYYLLQKGYAVTMIDRNAASHAPAVGEGVTVMSPLTRAPWHGIALSSAPVTVFHILRGSLTGGNTASTKISMGAVSELSRLWPWLHAYWQLSASPESQIATASQGALLSNYSLQCYSQLIKENPHISSCIYARGSMSIYENFDEVKDTTANQLIMQINDCVNIQISTAYNRLAPARNSGVDIVAFGNIDRVKAAEPFLEGAKTLGSRCEGALSSSAAVTGDGGHLQAALVQHLAASKDVTLVYEEDITGFEFDQQGKFKALIGAKACYTADVCVVAADAATQVLAEKLNLNMPLLNYQSYAISFPWKGPKDVSLFTSLTDVRRGVSITPAGSRQLTVAGFADVVGPCGGAAACTSEVKPSASRSAGLLKVAQTYFDSGTTDLPVDVSVDSGVECTVHLHRATPDELPLIGQVRPGLYVNAGHGAKALTDCWAAGSIVSDLVAATRTNDQSSQKPSNEFTSIDLSAISPVRFTGSTLTQ